METDALSRHRRWLTRLGPFLVLAFVTVLFAALLGWKDSHAHTHDLASFFSAKNLVTILTQTVIVAIGSLGMTLIIVSGGIDLSVGSVIALAGVVGAVLIEQGSGLAMAVAATIGVGVGVGLCNGGLIAGLQLTPFIVTLGMLGVARGLAKWLGGNQTVNLRDLSVGALMNRPFLHEALPPAGVTVAVGLAVLTGLVMQRTVFGRHLFALGSNEATARLCGIRTRLLKVWIYALAGVFFGLAGLMQLSRLRQGDPTAAIGLELDMIAAVVIGGASLSGGTGSVLGSMIGALTMAVLRTGSQYMDWPTYMQEIIIGGLIILAVGLDRIRQTRASAL
jgi:ribose transport system permease protein